ncbi:hypothetical protein ACFLXC_02430 [Chloroflexota bacterium]
MVNREAVKVLENNLAKRLKLFSKAIDDLSLAAGLSRMPLRHKVFAVDEMLLILIHQMDKLAFEKGIAEDVRATAREELVYNLVDRGITPHRIEDKLAERGIDLSADVCKEDSSTMNAALTLFLKEASEIDAEYGPCTQFAGETPGDDNGMVNKLATRVLMRWQPEDMVLWRLFIINMAGDVLAHENTVQEDSKALGTFASG